MHTSHNRSDLREGGGNNSSSYCCAIFLLLDCIMAIECPCAIFICAIVRHCGPHLAAMQFEFSRSLGSGYLSSRY